MNDLVKFPLVLGLVSLISVSVVTAVYTVTKSTIAAEERNDFLDGLKAVLPEFDNSPDIDAVTIDGETIYVAKVGDKVVGYAVQSISSKGYSGDIVTIVGVTPDQNVYGVTVVKHSETPGLGDGITTQKFLSLFKGKPISTPFAVKSDGGDIDQFSGATMSPRALCDAVKSSAALLTKVAISGGGL